MRNPLISSDPRHRCPFHRCARYTCSTPPPLIAASPSLAVLGQGRLPGCNLALTHRFRGLRLQPALRPSERLQIWLAGRDRSGAVRGGRARGWTWTQPGSAGELREGQGKGCWACEHKAQPVPRSSRTAKGSSLTADNVHAGWKGGYFPTALRIPLLPQSKSGVSWAGRYGTSLWDFRGRGAAGKACFVPAAEAEGAQPGLACRVATLLQRVTRGRAWWPGCLRCRGEPELVGMPCPTVCSRSTASLTYSHARGSHFGPQTGCWGSAHTNSGLWLREKVSSV